MSDRWTFKGYDRTAPRGVAWTALEAPVMSDYSLAGCLSYTCAQRLPPGELCGYTT
jgi:hypothetical protein